MSNLSQNVLLCTLSTKLLDEWESYICLDGVWEWPFNTGFTVEKKGCLKLLVTSCYGNNFLLHVFTIKI